MSKCINDDELVKRLISEGKAVNVVLDCSDIEEEALRRNYYQELGYDYDADADSTVVVTVLAEIANAKNSYVVIGRDNMLLANVSGDCLFFPR